MTLVAVMQPYLLPYVGYLQLMRAVDTFVWLDDAQFVKHRWMNRNRILLDGEVRWLTIPVRASTLSTSIRDKRYDLSGATITKAGDKLRHAYGGRPGWDSVSALLEELRSVGSDSVAEVNERLLVSAMELLGAEVPRLERASELGVEAKSAEARVIALCRAVGATEYVNLPGGRELYSSRSFAEAGLALSYLEPRLDPYPQGQAGFVAGLSIVDVIANAAVEAVGDHSFTIVAGD